MNKDLFRHMRDQIRPDPQVVEDIKQRAAQAPARRARESLLYIGGAAAACLLVAAGIFFAGRRFMAPPPVTPAGQTGPATAGSRTAQTAVPSSAGGPETDGMPTSSAAHGEASATHATPETGTRTHHTMMGTTGSSTGAPMNHSSGGDPSSTLVSQVTKAPLSPMSTETAGIEGEKVPFTLILQTKSGVGPDENSQLRLIRSYDELQALCADAGQGELWGDCLARYDKTYFKDSALVLLYVVRGSGSYSHRVDALTRSGEDLCLTVSDTAIRPAGDRSDDAYTCDMAYWRTVLEVRQADVRGVGRLTSYWKAWE